MPFAKEAAFMRFEICLKSCQQSLDWPPQSVLEYFVEACPIGDSIVSFR
jgi:hypothetical protein